MNYLDILIIVFIIISAIHGFKNGLIHEIASLASLILGIYLAVKFSGWAATKFQFFFSENTSFIVSFIVIFIIVSLGIYFVGKMLEKAFEEAELGPINKLAGMVFNIAKTIIILSVLIFILKFFAFSNKWPNEETRKKSFLFDRVETVAPAIYPLVVKRVKD